MNRKDDLTRCKSEDDFERVAPKVGRAKGISVVVENRSSHRGLLVSGRFIPLGHAGSHDLPPGTRHSILKSLAAVGLLGTILALLPIVFSHL